MKKLARILAEEKEGIIPLFIVQIVMLLFLGYVWGNPYINHVNFGILDRDNSALSRTIITNLQSSEGLKVSYFADSEEELQQAMKEQKISAGLMIPDDYSIDLASKRAPKLLLLSDGTNMSVGGNALSAASTVLSTLNAGVQIKTLEGYGVNPSSAQLAVSNFSYVERSLYETQGSNIPRNIYAVSLLLIIQIHVVRFIVPSLISKREVFASSNKSECAKCVLDLIERILVYIVASIAASFTALCLVGKFHGLPMRGEIWIYVVSMLAFMLNVTAFGIGCAALTKNLTGFMQLFTCITLTFMFTTGIPYPYNMMPAPLVTALKWLSPFAPMSVELKALNLKGIGWDVAYPYILNSLPYTAVWALAGITIYTFSVLKIRKKQMAFR